MQSKEELAVCCTYMCWVRIKETKPPPHEICKIIRTTFPELDLTESLIRRCINASWSICGMYNRTRMKDMFNTEKGAAQLFSSIWLSCCDSPPDPELFAKWLKAFFPKLDQYILSLEGELVASSLVGTYNIWDPTKRPRNKIKVLTRRTKRSNLKMRQICSKSF